MTDTDKMVIDDQIVSACRRARGEEQIPADESSRRVRGGHCDYSARGARRAHWYRMVWRDGAWQYFARPLAKVTMYADTRHQSEYGAVWHGEILAEHDLGGPVDSLYLVTGEKPGELLTPLPFTKSRDNRLVAALPDGSKIELPNPRK